MIRGLLMRKIKRICVISNYYPSEHDPIYSFLEEVVNGFSDRDIECFVITPTSYSEKKHRAVNRTVITANGNKVEIYTPRYLSMPGKLVGGSNAAKINGKNYCKAAYNIFIKKIKKCDIIYSHFISLGGIAAAYISSKTGIPCVIACGESTFDDSRLCYGHFNDLLKEHKAVICVSSVIKEQIEELKLFSQSAEKVVLPNGVDLNKFHGIDQIEARKEIGIPKDSFVAIFVGHFIKRKGIEETIRALNQTDGVVSIFIGDENLPIPCYSAKIVRKVQHDKLPIYLSAADVFVLPTKDEGCCNAIIEAQACGLPIISSDRPFNRDILSSDSAVLIDPNNVNEIINALEFLKTNDVKRREFGTCSRMKAIDRDIDKRIDRIIAILESCA